jgi:hypothetical protein
LPPGTPETRTIWQLTLRAAPPEDVSVTEINGLRLAYRGVVTGLAGGYVWAAAAMLGVLLAGGSPLAPLHILGGEGREGLLAGIGLLQVGSAAIGMTFAYFFGRYFTVRGTLALAGPCFAGLAWLFLLRVGLNPGEIHVQLALGAATLLYGVVLGAGLPLRAELARYSPSGSPST